MSGLSGITRADLESFKSKWQSAYQKSTLQLPFSHIQVAGIGIDIVVSFDTIMGLVI